MPNRPIAVTITPGKIIVTLEEDEMRLLALVRLAARRIPGTTRQL